MMRHGAATLWLAVAAGLAHAGPLPASPYTSPADSPFTGLGLDWFHLENFEDGALNTPGLSASIGFVLGPAPLTDSVESDDGAIDGSGNAGRSWYSNNSTAIRFGFSSGVLGDFPTHAGVVWTDVGFVLSGTDGFGDVELEAFDPGGASLGTVLAPSLGDGLFGGQTGEDRFLGFVHAGGISAIEIRMPASQDWEVDHVQYGYLVPAPGTLLLAALGAGLRLRRQRRA